MATNLNQPPASLKPVSHYLKVAVEHDTRDQVIAYWARFAAVQKALSIDKSSPEAKQFVIGLLDWLEKQKKALSTNEAVTIEAAGEAHIENYALKLFSWADSEDRSGNFNKNVVKAFYTAGILFDILESLRPPLSEEFTSARKYAKWKAAYIHNCLKNGEIPIPGGAQDEEEDTETTGGGASATSAFGFVNPSDQGNFTNPGSYTQPSDNTAPFSGTDYSNYQPTYPTQPQVPPQQFPPQDPYQFPSGAPPTSQFVDPTPPAPPQPTVNPYVDLTAGQPASSLSVEQIAKAQKYCKWAGSALNFDDVNSAIENLEKALHLLKTGQELG